MTRGLAVAAGIVAAFGCSNEDGDFDDTDDLEVEVISCEEAYARLERCCPDFNPQETGGCLDRAFQKTNRGCDSSYSKTTIDERPSLNSSESRCIRDASCDELVANGICRRGQAATRRRKGSSHSSSTMNIHGPASDHTIDEDHPPVCP